MEYRTPLGSFQTWEEAAAACERADLDPCNCIAIHETIQLGDDEIIEVSPGIIATMNRRLWLEKNPT